MEVIVINPAGLPAMHMFTTIGGFNVMIIEYLGKNLQELLDVHKKFSIKTVCMIGIQIVYFLI
jgi:hypothetical protein